MPNATFAQRLAQRIHHIVAGDACGFIDEHKAMHLWWAPLCHKSYSVSGTT